MAASDPRDIVSSRLFHQPRQDLFDAFRDPKRLPLWWGPDGFTNTLDELDFRVGGNYRITMHGPDGTNYKNESVFTEIVEPGRIVFDHLRTMHRFIMTMTFDDVNGATRLTWVQRFDTAEECERVRQFAGPANEQNFDRLAYVLSATLGQTISMSVSDREVHVVRAYDAPLPLVYQAWTDVKHLANWWGPDGFRITTKKFDFKPGGEWIFTMHGPDGTAYPNRIVYSEIVPEKKLLITHGSDGVDGPAGDIQFVNSITFEERLGKTRVEMRSVFAKPEMREKAIRQFGAIEGGKQHMAKLAKYLKT